MYGCMYVHMYVWMCVYACMYVRMYVCLGPSWILLECLMGVLRRLECILGTSGEHLGASSERPSGTAKPAGDHTWTSGSAENRGKIMYNRNVFYDRFVDAILMPKSAQNEDLALCNRMLDNFSIWSAEKECSSMYQFCPLWRNALPIFKFCPLWRDNRQFSNLELFSGKPAIFLS